MSCERYAQAIEDHACGADLAAAAAAHLDSCMRCAAAFEAQRRALEDLEAELQRAVAIDPSPAFAPGVRAGIDRASSAGYRLAWLAAPLAVGAAIAIAVLVGAPGNRPAAPATPPKPAPAPASSTIARATPDLRATVPAVPVPVADSAATDTEAAVPRDTAAGRAGDHRAARPGARAGAIHGTGPTRHDRRGGADTAAGRAPGTSRSRRRSADRRADRRRAH